MSGSRFPVRSSPDLDLFIPLPSADPSSLFLFCPEDIDVLLVLIPRPVNRAVLLLNLPVRLLVLEYAWLDSALSSTLEDLLESLRGAPNFKPPSQMRNSVCAPVDSNLLMMEPFSNAFNPSFFG